MCVAGNRNAGNKKLQVLLRAVPPPPVPLILSLPILYSLKAATLPYRYEYAHPDTVVVDQQQLLNRTSSVETEYRQRYET